MSITRKEIRDYILNSPKYFDDDNKYQYFLPVVEMDDGECRIEKHGDPEYLIKRYYVTPDWINEKMEELVEKYEEEAESEKIYDLEEMVESHDDWSDTEKELFFEKEKESILNDAREKAYGEWEGYMYDYENDPHPEFLENIEDFVRQLEADGYKVED